jgi:hypothetical protein
LHARLVRAVGAREQRAREHVRPPHGEEEAGPKLATSVTGRQATLVGVLAEIRFA